MKRLALALLASTLCVASAGAQVVPPGTNPVPSAGAYNSTPPTCVSGQYCALQADVNGNLKVAGGGIVGGDINITGLNGAAPSVTNPLIIVQSSQYPSGATPLMGNGTGTTGAVVGTLTSASAKTAYICGFDVSAIGGTAAVGPVTIAGTITASMIYYLSSTAAGITLSRSFNPCIPASAVNTNITVTTTADGSASNVAVNSYGYLQ